MCAHEQFDTIVPCLFPVSASATASHFIPMWLVVAASSTRAKM